MSKEDFLLELGCEELPQHGQQPIATQLSNHIQSALKDHRIAFKQSQVYTSPRRICIHVVDLALKQTTETTHRIGPNIESAFDKQGTPTMACLGFANSCGLSTDQLEVIETDKGKRIAAAIKQAGEDTFTLLPNIIETAINQLNLPKSMRWGEHLQAFIRPVQWILALYGKSIVPVRLFDHDAANKTFGHRYHHPKSIQIHHPKDYRIQLYSQGYVIAETKDREKVILKQIEKYNSDQHACVIDPSLLKEVTALVEWPVTLMGRFDKQFLYLPKEVLITSMHSHQKCFPMLDASHQLTSNFLLVSNIESSSPETIISGNEKVINARLSDAMFFYQNDLRHTLYDRLTKLGSVVFQEQLGSMKDKVTRLVKLCQFLSKSTPADTAILKRAAQLSKSDLISEMVVEFPSLQGTMGYYYAINDNENPTCATAIQEHYKPRFADDDLPTTPEGATLAIADRLDSIVGIIGINLKPTADKDPYALRRAALGIIRIILENHYNIDLVKAIRTATKTFSALTNEDVEQDVLTFIIARLKAWYQDQGVNSQIFNAVAYNPIINLYDFHLRILAVKHFLLLPQAQALAIANKRVNNLLKKHADTQKKQAIDSSLFIHEAEHQLAAAISQQHEQLMPLIDAVNYTEALTLLADLEQPIDNFFEHVMVIDQDIKVRSNRLRLLSMINQLFLQIADISQLQTQ